MEDRGKAPCTASQTVGNGADYLPRRLELPVFEGIDPNGWIFLAERYFDINGLRADERLRATMVCMEGLRPSLVHLGTLVVLEHPISGIRARPFEPW